MEVFTSAFAEYMIEEPACNIENIVPLTIISIRHADCLALQLVPIQEVSEKKLKFKYKSLISFVQCPVLYDIVRRSGNYLWMGNQFPGDPVQWASTCQEEDRPRFADEYSFLLSSKNIGNDNNIIFY